MMAKAGKYDGCLLEGMACPDGCIAGAGTIQPITKATAAVAKAKGTANLQNPLDSQYGKYLPVLEDE